jgi:hypothetical protein
MNVSPAERFFKNEALFSPGIFDAFLWVQKE